MRNRTARSQVLPNILLFMNHSTIVRLGGDERDIWTARWGGGGAGLEECFSYKGEKQSRTEIDNTMKKRGKETYHSRNTCCGLPINPRPQGQEEKGILLIPKLAGRCHRSEQGTPPCPPRVHYCVAAKAGFVDHPRTLISHVHHPTMSLGDICEHEISRGPFPLLNRYQNGDLHTSFFFLHLAMASN